MTPENIETQSWVTKTVRLRCFCTCTAGIYLK